MVNWRFTRGTEEQMEAFLAGFADVFPLEWLQYFDERELEVLDAPSNIAIPVECKPWPCKTFFA